MFKRLRLSRKSSTKDAQRENLASSKTLTGTESATWTLPTRNTQASLASDKPSGSNLGSSTLSPFLPSTGLHVLHAPELCAVDIIFIHGLGGHSYKTWAKNKEPSLFWPQSWLPFEPDMDAARVLTFGYHAGWRGQPKSTLSMGDFAKDLLYEMRFAKDETGNDLCIGSKPIIFIAHSMGGLVVKKALLTGMYDENYTNIVTSISGIIFLSTPHRGSNLAETLNRIVSATLQSPRSFISDLQRGSTALEELNEQFRHIAPRLSIWSFYETVASSIGPKRLLVLEKDTAVLGYPGEISKPLHADHQNVCKYNSPSDINYISIRNAIRHLATTCCTRSNEVQAKLDLFPAGTAEEIPKLQDLFRDCATSEDDYTVLRQLWLPDTCDWFLKEPQIQSWIAGTEISPVFWYSAPPANGKSVLSAFVASHLRNMQRKCQYFFFKHSEPRKSSTAAALKAIALQMAIDAPDYAKNLGNLPKESLGLSSDDSVQIWKNVVERAFKYASVSKPLYWILDGLDECADPQRLMDCLKSLAGTSTSIRVLIVSRHTDSIAVAFEKLSPSVPISRLKVSSCSKNGQDIETLVDQELIHMRGSHVFLQDLKQIVLSRSSGNFLWTKLVLNEIMSCHTEESIQQVLDEIPDDLLELYQRMENSILKTNRKSNIPLIRALLEWSTCSHRPLSLKEMSQALHSEFPRILDLSRTINDLCGQFVQISGRGNIEIIHHSAREYFMRTRESPLFIDEKKTHSNLFKKTIGALSCTGIRQDLTQSQHATPSSWSFAFYSAVTWCSHLEKSAYDDAEILDTLAGFFRSTFVLSWIHILSLLERVDILVEAAESLTSFVANARKSYDFENFTPQISTSLQLLEDWATDLTKLVGKFGRMLVTAPNVIYDVVPELSPGQTAISRQGSDTTISSFQISGLESEHWTDNLGCLPLPPEAQGWSICCKGKTLAVLESTGTIYLLNTSSFMPTVPIDHGGPVTAIALNLAGTRLATCGLKETKVFSVASRDMLFSIPNTLHTKILSFVFAEDDTKILTGGDDGMIRYASCDPSHQGWQKVHDNLLNETLVDGAITNSPTSVQFNNDSTLLGVAYRGAPMSVWKLADGRCINKCRRAKDFMSQSRDRRPSKSWSPVDQFTWNPITGHILGLYRGGCIFKWHPLTDEVLEVRQAANDIAASPNGKLFATSSSDGSVDIWSFSHFSVIYHLSSDDLVMGLCFSPDSRRFYSLGRNAVNAWEPKSMAHFKENKVSRGGFYSEEPSSTAVSKYSEKRLSTFDAITAIAVSPDGRSYCAGYEDGGVLLFKNDDQEGVELVRFYNFLEVTHIVWSPNSRYVAAADLAGDIQIVSLVSDPDDTAQIDSTSRPQLDLKDSNVDQIFFSQDEIFLFLSTEQDCFVWSLHSEEVLASLELNSLQNRKWSPHPGSSELLLCCSLQDAFFFSWRNLQVEETISVVLKDGSPLSSSPQQNEQWQRGKLDAETEHSRHTEGTLRRVEKSEDHTHLLLVSKQNGVGAQSHEAVWISELSSWAPTASKEVNFWSVPNKVSRDIHVFLGLLSGSKFVFLDRDLWVCVFNPGQSTSTEEPYQRYYFIPRDWVGRESLNSCAMMADGTLFWPRSDKVLRIRCDFDFARPITTL